MSLVKIQVPVGTINVSNQALFNSKKIVKTHHILGNNKILVDRKDVAEALKVLKKKFVNARVIK